MGLLSSVGAIFGKAATKLIKGSGDKVADRIVSGLNPLQSLIKLGSLGAIAAKPAVKTIATAAAKATVGVIKRPAAVVAGAAIAGVASPGLGRKATGVGAATAIGGPVAGGIVAGLIGLDYAKKAYLQIEPEVVKKAESIKTSITSSKSMSIAASSITNPKTWGITEDELKVAQAMGAELTSTTGQPGQYAWYVNGKPVSLSVPVEQTKIPVSGVAPEVNSGLGGLLPEGIGSVLIPAVAGAAVVGGAYAYSRRKKKKSTKKTKTPRKKTKTKSRTKRRTKTRRVGSAKQYRKAGGKSVRYTKSGQPYIILKSGKARFIKK